MNIVKRDQHLDEVLGIKEKEEEKLPVIVEEGSTEIVPSENEDDSKAFKKELKNTCKKLHKMMDSAEEVLESAKDNAISFGKSRDVEAFSSLLRSMTEIQRDEVMVNEKLYDKEEKKHEASTVNKQQNVFIGDYRDLLNVVNKENEE